MLLVHNRTGLILGALGVFAAMVTIAVTGSVGIGGLVLAAAWIGGGVWWKRRPTDDGVPAPYPSVYFIPLPYLAAPVALLAVGVTIFELKNAPSGGTDVASGPSGRAARRPSEASSRGPTAPRPELAPDADVIERLVYDAGDDHRGRRSGALNKLARMEPQPARREEVLAVVRPLLRGDDQIDLALAAEVLGTWGTPEEALPVLADLTEHENSAVRSEAVEGLGRFRDPLAVETLARRLLDTRSTAMYARKALVQQGDAAEPALISRLSADMDTLVFRDVCEVLEQVGGAASVEALRPFLDHDEIGFRLKAEDTIEAIQRRQGGPLPSP